MKKRAVILAGGKGTRLRPYTVVLPKPLMPIGDYPILEVVIRQLASRGFEHITIAVSHQAELIRAFFGDDRNSAIGGLTGSLAATGIPENAARVYAVCIRAGQTLLSVHANDFKWVRKAMKIFEQTGAKDIIRTPETEADCRHQAGPSSISGTEDDL